MSSGHTVYLVDDDASVRAGLARLMRTAGYEVFVFGSARAFLDALEPEASGCIVLDSRMPEMSGEELLRELRERDVDFPIIFVTADETPELRQTAERIKAAGFFRKPVDGPALLDAVKWVLR